MQVTNLSVVTITSSVDYASGSNVFGSNISNTQVFTGSILATGSVVVVGSISGGAISGTTGTFTGAGIFGNAATGSQLVTIKGGTSGATDGAALYLSNGASTINAFGNKSSIFGGGYDANVAVYAGAGLNIGFYPDGSSTVRALVTTTGLAVTGELSATTTIHTKSATVNPASTGALTGVSIAFDANAEVGWIQSERNSLAETRTLQLNPNGGLVTCGAGLAVTGAISGGAISGTTLTFTGNLSGPNVGYSVGVSGDSYADAWQVFGSGAGGAAHTLVGAIGGLEKLSVTSTGLNSTVIGATTPAQGNFTFLFQGTSAAQGLGAGFSGVAGQGFTLRDTTNSRTYFVTTETSTGLQINAGANPITLLGNTAITGTLSAYNSAGYGNVISDGTSGGSFTIKVGGTAYGSIYGNATNTVLDSGSSTSLYIQTGGATRGLFTSTGLAVTGALSATGRLTITQSGGIALKLLSGTQSVDFQNNSGTLIQQLLYNDSDGSLTVGGGASNFPLNLRVGSTTIGALTSTGLAVTGALSATGAISGTGLLTLTVADATNGNSIRGATGRFKVTGYTDATNGAVLDSVNTAEGAYLPMTLRSSDHRVLINGSLVTDTSSTGLAVTGALSATGVFTTYSQPELVRSSADAGYQQIQWRDASTFRWTMGLRDGDHDFYLRAEPSGINVLKATSTGLAVTGALSASGDVGIGTTSPGTKLDVQAANASLRVYGTGASDTPQFQLRNGSQIWQQIVDGADSHKWKLKTGGGTTVLNCDPSGGLAVTGALSATGAISSTLTGNDITPLSLLDSTLANGNYTQILLGKATNSNECAVIKFTQNATTSVLGFQMFGDGSPGLTISKGASGIAAISSTGLAVTGDISASGSGLFGTSAVPSATVSGVVLRNPRTVDDCRISVGNISTSSLMLSFYNTNGRVGDISTNGSLTIFNTASDYRLKNITGPVVDSGTFIDALKPKVGTWKSDGSKFVGFLAHEFAEVSPSSVQGKKDAVDDEGNPKYQGMQAGTSEVIANIVAELQSLRKRLAGLESK